MTDQERDLRVTLRVRNARILRRIEATGLSVKGFCEKFQLPPTSVNNLIGMKWTPLVRPKKDKTDWDWRPIAWFLSSALQCEPEDLWPDWMRVLERKRTTISFDASVEELKQVEIATKVELDYDLLPILTARWPDRMREMILENFAGKKQTEIAEKYGLSRGRTHQIIDTGLRRARERARRWNLDIDGSFKDEK